MRDKDTIILESLYTLVVEKAKDVIDKLKTMNVPDELVNQFIAVDPTGQKNDAYALGKLYSQQEPNPKYLIALYKQFLKFKNKNNSQTKDFPRQFDSIEKLEKTIGDLNSIETIKLVKDKDEGKRLLRIDPTNSKLEAATVAKWIGDSKGRLLDKDVVDDYERFVELKERNIEGSEDVTKYNGYIAMTEFIHMHMGEDDGGKIDTGGKVNITKKPVYNDDEIAIWYIDNPQESISIGNALIDLADVRTKGGTPNWCTTWPIVGSGGMSNMFTSYRTNNRYTFYYTWSKNRAKGISGSTPNDQYVITAIAVTEGGKYVLTPAPNGTRASEDWSRIVEWMPELEGKEGYFKYKPISGEDQNKMVTYERMARYFNEEQFLNLSQFQQYEYIQMGFDIPPKTFPKLSKERMNDYLNIMANDLDRELPEKLEAILTPEQLKRYQIVHERAWENHLQGVEAAL